MHISLGIILLVKKVCERETERQTEREMRLIPPDILEFKMKQVAIDIQRRAWEGKVYKDYLKPCETFKSLHAVLNVRDVTHNNICPEDMQLYFWWDTTWIVKRCSKWDYLSPTICPLENLKFEMEAIHG